MTCLTSIITVIFAVIFGMYADESYSYVQKDEMDRKVLETEGHVSPALSSLFREVIVCLVICETMCERNDFSLLEMTVQYYGLFSNSYSPCCHACEHT